MIYLDNAATTRVSETALQGMTRMAREVYGNPSSLHSCGFQAEQALQQARRILAKAAGVLPEEFYFTPSGTVADNTAIRGYLASKRKGRIITSMFEHPAVLECFRSLENQFDVVYLKPENGVITSDCLRNALTPDTLLVSVMHVNNETGAVQDIRTLAAMTHRVGGAVFHTDAIQAFCKEQVPYSVCDMASFSGHKNHGPKGIGGLYVKKGLHVKPVLLGGGQEHGLVSGTHNTPAAVAWADAVSELVVNRAEYCRHVTNLNCLMRRKLAELDFEILSPDKASPYVLFAMKRGYLGENILHALDEKGICIATGSACSSKKGSHVMHALGRGGDTKYTVRISFSHENTEDDVLQTAAALAEVLARLVTV